VEDNPFDVNAASSYGTSVGVTKQFHRFPGLAWHSKSRKLSKELYLLIAIAVYGLGPITFIPLEGDNGQRHPTSGS